MNTTSAQLTTALGNAHIQVLTELTSLSTTPVVMLEIGSDFHALLPDEARVLAGFLAAIAEAADA